MPDLLFEVGTEELPPSELPLVLAALGQRAGQALEDARLGFGDLRVLSTPRRLALRVSGLAERQAAHAARIMGPPKKAAFDAEGRPTRAAQGFARAQGRTVGELITVATERGDYVALDRVEPGRTAREVLPELLERLTLGLPFTRQMRWGDGDVRFSRPIRWLLALLDGDVLPMSVAGIAAGRLTSGHRFAAPQAIILATPADYVETLRRAFVVVDVDERRALIRREVDAAGRSQGGRAVIDEATLETVVHLVEWPVAVVGSFAESYLDLPREVVETPIRRHQKCFPVETATGELAPLFVTVSNTPGADATEIRLGNERVIRARLADAAFYFQEDLKARPEDRLPLLKGMVFQERLGNLLEKTERVVALADFLAERVGAGERDVLQRAARLLKSDLPSGMVREFPELEGVIGAEYARRAGERAEVAQAIREHYQPRSADDRLPASLGGALLSVADKTDTVVGCLGVGLMPTGSQDPYALRRQAQAILQIVLGRSLRLSLAALVARALELLSSKLTESPEATQARALEFLRLRLATLLGARGLRADVVDAVLSQAFDDPVQALRRAEALTAMMPRPDWEPLVVTFKRAINILPARPIGAVDPARFVHEAERHLHAETARRLPGVGRALAHEDYATVLTELAGLRPAVDAFFEAVMVMDKDPAIQENRLALLRALGDVLLPIADLRRIQGI
jgi:glycyl-tRNA synthetase beta chain